MCAFLPKGMSNMHPRNIKWDFEVHKQHTIEGFIISTQSFVQMKVGQRGQDSRYS